MDLDYIVKTFLETLKGVPTTLIIMIVAMVLSFVPALFLALGQIYKVKGVRTFSLVYLAFIRATPPILLILFFYSLFPSLLNQFLKSIGSNVDIFKLNPIYYAFIIYSLMTTGSLSEILRSAILTVDKGQLEAAQAIGLTSSQAYVRIVFPQALRSALPNLANLVINIVKGTSLVFVMTIKDITAIEKERIKAQEEQPVWGMIQIDNIEELTKGLSDREYTNLWAEINNIVVDEIDKHEGFIRNFQDDMYTFAISRGALQDMENNGFNVLERIRKLPSPRQVPATISIGIGENAGSVKDVSERARAALDIALGRGGDQVCIMDGESTRFFGGNTAGVEKNTRVRARVVSQAIHELMNDSDKILVMGHQREDYDALGGAIGVVSIARTLGKEVRLVLSKETNAIDKMVHVLVEDEFWKTHILTPAEAKLWADANTDGSSARGS